MKPKRPMGGSTDRPEVKRYSIHPHNSGGYTLKRSVVDDDANVVRATDYDALEARWTELKARLHADQKTLVQNGQMAKAMGLKRALMHMEEIDAE